MKRLKVLLFSLTCMTATAQAESIIWLGAEFPPMYISQGPHANQGYMNALFSYLQQALPQHNFSESVAPWPRVMHMAEQGGPYCLLAAFKTPEREAFLRFSKPYGHLLPLGLVVSQEQTALVAPYLDTAGRIDLERLLKNPQIRPGIASGRSYGSLIDTLLQSVQGTEQSSFARVYQGESTSALFNMLDRRRIDYTFSYPSEMVYFTASHQHLRFYPIAGNEQLLPGRLSCTRSPQTDRVFAELNQILSGTGHQAVFKAAYERWLPDYLLEPYRAQLAQLPAE
ncbi:TIGR02285 family protein [Aquipseudomonas guryensis]|uniref:TIGR02285 family protein n=1 Tax=Aquipseudomonas guryensis TaxID=2759165 RepID=A0A7W4DD25_9GAMM|nr:TIGR02285 family protein [Pseudomonas guryensis]MBB1520311.1 TIGR02285 family protein [Pseudomonas guryensis]